MASTAVSICNRALSRIGAQLISSLSANSVNAQHCNTLYEPTRDEVLAAHDWAFAIKRADLSKLAATYTGWDYAYQLPSDCVHPIDLIGDSKAYKIEGQVLLTDVDNATLRYVGRITDPTKYPVAFTEVLALRLASKLAGPIKNAKRLEQELIQEYLMQLMKARGDDAEHAHGEDEPELWHER